MKQLFIGLALALALCTVSSAHVSDTQFQQWMKEEVRLTGRQIAVELPVGVRDHAQHARYVFVNGFLGETFHHAFLDMMRTLQGLGVEKNHIYKLVPSSTNTMDQNLAFLKSNLNPVLQGNDDPIVLIGFSRGAVETLAYALSAPKDVRDRIHALYLVHGAFGGSPLADWVAGKPMPMDDRLPGWVRAGMEWVRKFDLTARIPKLEEWTGIPLGEGLLSLTHDAETEFWTRHVRENRASADELNDRIYYVRGWQPSKEMNWKFRAFGYYMDLYYGPNDGVVPYNYQAIEGLGSTLVTLRDSHTSLIDGGLTRELKVTSRALIDAIFTATGTE